MTFAWYAPTGSGSAEVTSGIWRAGNAASSAGVAQVNWQRENSSYPVENEAGIWAGHVVFDHAINADFGASNGTAPGPVASLFVMANATGSASDVVAVLGDA